MNVEHAVSLLAAWLPNQRWFAGKDEPIDAVRTVAATRLHESKPEVWHLMVEVEQGHRREIYQVPVSFRDQPDDRLEHVLVGDAEGRYVYDALHDKDATAELLRRFAAQDRVNGLSFHTEPGAVLPVGESSLVLTAEQSNTSLAYGDAALLKVFRRVVPGVNPDVEVHDALTRAGNEYVAPMLGWLDGWWVSRSGRREEAGLAMLQTFLVTATDGWALATTSVRDLYAEADLHADEVGGDFAGESQRLGLATAEVHAAMADVLPTRLFASDDLSALAGRMRARLDAAVATVPELTTYAPSLAVSFDRLARLRGPVPAQRIHGDYHLGQVVRTVVGWKLVDFEGEPARPLAERVALDSPIRDVAAMLRSFDYAARHLLVVDHPGSEQIAYRAVEWAERNRAAFCEGYAKAAGHDPRDDDVLLRAYETDKVVYEAVYEARNRPSWLTIPLAGAESLATDQP
ncbi:MAG TPA: aminoglycoside phosphotransferase [Jiangellaceae bacterium]|nr:aminoglycoside phosphotransferase [Jiangellaceae bacterium]